MNKTEVGCQGGFLMVIIFCRMALFYDTYIITCHVTFSYFINNDVFMGAAPWGQQTENELQDILIYNL